jgi:hypothetical protein
LQLGLYVDLEKICCKLLAYKSKKLTKKCIGYFSFKKISGLISN